MDVSRFWQIIEESRSDFDPHRRDGNMDLQVMRLRKTLSQFRPQEVAEFDHVFSRLFHDAYRWDLWAAAYIIEGGCSDDGFTDFRYWLISMGRDAYMNAMHDVETLASIAFGSGIEVTRFEEFGSVASQILYKAHPDFHDDLPIIKHPQEPAGKAWEDEDLEQRFPRLWSAARDFQSRD